MPLLLSWMLNAAVALAWVEVAAPELRASPRDASGLRSFRALALHQAMVASPALLYLLVRYPDWSFGYLVDGQRVPSAVGLCLAALQCALGVGTFSVGARWLRGHHPRRVRGALGILAVTAFVGVVALRERVLQVGTTVQFRGGFGLRPLFESELALALGWAFAVQAAAIVGVGVLLRRGEEATR